MAITSNFDKDNFGRRHGEKLILNLPSGHVIGTDSPSVKPGKNCTHLWMLSSRRRLGKSWRDDTSIN